MTERSIREEAEIRGMKSGMERGFQQGMQDGIQQGIQQGANEKAIEGAKNLLKENVPVETIAHCLGLTLNEVQNLSEEIATN